MSFSNVEKWLRELKENTSDSIITLIGNKIDLRHLRAVTVEEGSALAGQYLSEYKI
jgi:Ras-related protein Rab-11A